MTLSTDSFLSPELLETLSSENVLFKEICNDLTESDLYLVFDVLIKETTVPIFISINKNLLKKDLFLSVHLDSVSPIHFPCRITESIIKETKRTMNTFIENFLTLLKEALLQTPHRLRLLTQENYFDFKVHEIYLTDLYSTMLYQREMDREGLSAKTLKRFTQ